MVELKSTLLTQEYTRDDVVDPEMLQSILEQYGIDLTVWGTGRAKTLAEFVIELQEKETLLVLNEEGHLARKLRAVAVNVFYRDTTGVVWHLTEDRQEFIADGRVRRRTYQEAVSGKMKEGENPLIAAQRELGEELVISINDESGSRLSPQEPYEHDYDSQSYPGLKTDCAVHPFELWLNSEEFHPEGYVQDEAPLRIYFVWEQINNQEST